jgi:hypothetical protein
MEDAELRRTWEEAHPQASGGSPAADPQTGPLSSDRLAVPAGGERKEEEAEAGPSSEPVSSLLGAPAARSRATSRSVFTLPDPVGEQTAFGYERAFTPPRKVPKDFAQREASPSSPSSRTSSPGQASPAASPSRTSSPQEDKQALSAAAKKLLPQYARNEALEVVALHDYRPLKDLQLFLRLRKGFTYFVLKEEEPGWLKAMDTQGTLGLIPEHYVVPAEQLAEPVLKHAQEKKTILGNAVSQRAVLEAGEYMCEALFTYEAKEPEQLSFQRGDLLTVVTRRKGGWWTGKIRGEERVGTFHRGFVQYHQTLELTV